MLMYASVSTLTTLVRQEPVICASLGVFIILRVTACGILGMVPAQQPGQREWV